MRIGHLAIWVRDLEKMRSFYCDFFDLESSDLYHNPRKKFSSYFLSFPKGARLELMHREENISDLSASLSDRIGLAHFAIALGNQSDVLAFTAKAKKEGIKVPGEPRTTGDGYFESVIEDPEGNWIELTV